MKPHRQICVSALPLSPKPRQPGEAQQPGPWNWQSEPEQWARSVRQHLNAQLLVVSDMRVDSSPEEASAAALEPRHCQRRQEQFLKAVTQSLPGLELLVAELRTLFSAVLQDGSPQAWHYLYAVLRLLPPYRALLAGHLDLLPFLEQLYRWAPWVQSQLQLDLLDAIDQAFPPDSSLLESASHVDCCLQKQRFCPGPPLPACPFVRARRDGQQGEAELATWLRPLTLPELQHSLGIVGAKMALKEAQWQDGLSLLPLALGTDIPVQYESSGTGDTEQEPVGRRKTKSQLDSEVSRKRTFRKSSTDLLPPISLLGSQAMTILKTERQLKKIHFLYLNVAPGRYFRPYSLVVVPPNKVNPEHYIFSPFGVLHVHPEEDTEAMTLGTWHRHSVLWQQLQFIPFFKNCLLRKAWACWKKTVTFQGLHRCRAFLGKHLLLAVPHFGAALLHISRLLQELHSVSWLPQELDECYELLDLKQALAKENHKALQLLSRCLRLCTSILHMVHEDTYQMQQGLQERVKNCERIRTGQGSIYLQKMQRQHLERKLKRAETWLLQLGQLARLVNFMICQSLVSIIEEKITSFVANILQAPRENPFLSAQLIFDSGGQLSQEPCIESMIEILTGHLQFIKASALKVMQSTDLKTPPDSLYPEGEDEEEDSSMESLMPKSQGQPSDAVHIFCGPNVGLVWPWKSHTITEALEVRGYRLRGQYLPPSYKQLQEDLDNSPRIQQALTIQQALLKDMLWEVQEFCREHHWMTGIHEFLQSWGPQKLESMRGCPIKNYVMLVSHLNIWQNRISNIPVKLITKGKLLLLSCHDVQADVDTKLKNIRKEILAHVQSECWSRSQHLMKELRDFVEIFQTISSDIRTIASCSQKLNEAHDQYGKLEERMEYIRSLHELIRNHFSLFSAETEALDILVRREFRKSPIPPCPPPPQPHPLDGPVLAPQLLDLWEAFQFERSQASEFLLSKQHSLVPKLQQLMGAALAELEGLIQKALSSPFMDPAQEQKSMESQLISLEHQFQDTVSRLNELRHAYSTFTGDESPVSLPICGIHPIKQQQSIWRLYRVISENISEWKCMAFAKFNLPMAQEKIEGWLTEATQMNATLGLHSPVLQCTIRLLEEFRSYLPLLTKLSSFQLHSLSLQALLRALGLGSLNVELLTLGQLLTCPLLEFADQINQIWRNENEHIHAQETLQQLQQAWEGRKLRLLNFILHVPYEPQTLQRSKRHMHRTHRDIVAKDSGTFILSDYSSLQDSIQKSLQVLFKILVTQKLGDLHKIALEWVTILRDLSHILQVWVTFQQKWMFLNKVLHEMMIQFPSSDLNSRFKAMDDQYRTLMQTSVADPLVLSLVVPSAKRNPYYQGQQLQQLLQAGSVELEGIIMALQSVLYGFCVHFPRLFFLSDIELVSLLVARMEPCEAQIWVRRCFPHVLAVSFKSSSTDEHMDAPESRQDVQPQVECLAVLGAGGEEVELQQPLPLHPDLPKWLASLEKGLRLALVHMLQGCVAARLRGGVVLAPFLDKAFKELPQKGQVPLQLNVHHWLDLVEAFPWQCVLVAEEVVWWAEMEEALLEERTLAMVRTHVCKLEVLVRFVRTQRASQGGQSLPSVRQASLLSALLAMAVTHRDIVQLLREHQVSDLTDFHWARQLKYHLGSPHIIPRSPLQSLKTTASMDTSLSPAGCWIEVLGRSFLYNYEYLGPRLGSLPSLLPERPALVLLLALEEVACGTLLGPDGIGKAAMVKSLAQALGRQLVIIPCLPQTTAQSLSNYLNGALQGGAWLLLEAAQHLPLGLLSALGQRLAELHNLYAPLYQQASRSTSTIDPTHPHLLGSGFFEKHHVDMRLGYGCFLTLRALSPAVPANLRLLLRPVALTLPNLQQVAELTLLGAGMRDPSRMATHLSKFFFLEHELVPGPLPYHLPLLKQVLTAMIQALNVTKEEPSTQPPHSLAAIEEMALLRALIRSPLFSILDGVRLHNLQELLCGIFPSARQVLAEPVTHKLRKPLLVEELQQAGLHPTPNILGSLEQLSQALDRASGILLLGPAGSGKTTCWHSLFTIQNQLAGIEGTSTWGCPLVEITHLYPSVFSTQELLGWQEGPCWHQGILPRLLHSSSQCKTVDPKSKAQESVRIQHWIICDGAPSAAWLDAVTCLLGNPPQLILPSGEQIERSPDTFFLMEVGDATGMSPKVVGHCALVWCGGEQTWQGMLSVLMAALPREYCLQPQTVTELNRLAKVLVPATLRFLTREGACSLLQAHGQVAVCPGVAEITSLARLLHCLLDLHLRIDEETHMPGEEDLSHSDPVASSFKSSKTSSLTGSLVDSNDLPNKHREHLLVVSSFLFALIWGFGAHLPSRLWPLFDTFLRHSISCLSNYPEPPVSASVFDLHVCPEDGTLVPFTGQYMGGRIKGSLGTFSPSPQAERLLYVVDLLLSAGHPVLLAGEAATGKSAFVAVLVEPHHPYVYTPIHPAFSTTHFRLLLSRGVQGQARANPWPGQALSSKGSLLFLLEDLHLAASDPEKSCQPVLETLRQAMSGAMFAHSTLELQKLQPIVNFLATATVPGFCERPLDPRLFRLFTVLALADMTQAMLLSRHTPIIQAWLERFHSVEREGLLARALVCASVEAWEAVGSCFMPSPLHPHYRFSLHSVSQLLGSLQLLPTRTGSRGFLDYPNHQEHLRRVSGLRGTRLTTMMAMRNMVRLWLHEAQRTFCDRLDSPRERTYCAKLLLEVAQSTFCCGPVPQNLGKGYEEEEEEEERVPEVESEGELAKWEGLSNSSSETEGEEDPPGFWVTTGSPSSDSGLASAIAPVKREEISQKINQEEGTTAPSYKAQLKRSKNWWQKASQMDSVTPLLLPVLLLCPQEKPSDLVFSRELIVGSNSDSPNLYLERQWESLGEQLAMSAAQLKLSPHLARCRSMAQHVARLVRVLARPRQHGLLLSGALGTGRCTAITLAASICQAHLFHLPCGSEEAILQCLWDASWHAGMLGQPVALLVPTGVDLTTLHRLLALASSGSFPDQYTQAHLDNIEEHLLRENLSVKQTIRKEMLLQRFYQQVCSHLHMFILIGDDQAHKQLPSTLFLRLLQLGIASIDRYEPWDQDSLVSVAQHHLEGVQNLPLGDEILKYPDLQASVSSVAKAMALIHLSAASYHGHLCPELPLVTPKTFLDFLDTFVLLQQQMILKMQSKAQRVHDALGNLTALLEHHNSQTNQLSILEQELKDSLMNLSTLNQQLEQGKLLYKRQLAECRHQENLIKNLTKQCDALRAQHEAFLEQMGKAFLGPLSQLKVTDFEEIRSYRAPPESVIQVTDTLCDLFHRERGWASAKQLLCTEDFYQELVFFPKEKMTDSEVIKLSLALNAPGMRDAALRAVSTPAASLAAWLWAVLHYRLAQHRVLPTGLLLRQVEATLAREQAHLAHYQFQAQRLLEHSLALTEKLEDAQASHSQVVENFSWAQSSQYHKWPIKSALLMPKHSWTTELQKLKRQCMTVFGDALLCSAAITYLGPFPPLRRQELLAKWLALCRGFQETLGPDDVAQALKKNQKSVITPPKRPLLSTRTPFSLLALLSSESEQFQWDTDLKPQAKSARLAGLLLRSHTHYYSCRWPLVLDPSKQALIWLNPLPLEHTRCLSPAPTKGRGKARGNNHNASRVSELNQEKEYGEEGTEEEDKRKEQKAEESGKEEAGTGEKQAPESPEDGPEGRGARPASEDRPPPAPCLRVLSGSDPDLGPQLLEAAACGLPVLLTHMELGLGCQELQWLLQRGQLSPAQVQPGFCLYLSTTLPLRALEKALGCELLKGLNVLDLGLNMDILEEQMLHEILCVERPELKNRWQDLKMGALDTFKAVEAAEERLLLMLLFQNTNSKDLVKFLRDMVRTQAELCQLHVYYEELEDLRLQEVEMWVPYRRVVQHAITIIKALIPLHDLLPPFRMSPENCLAATKRALSSMKQCEGHRGQDLPSHLLQLRTQLTRQLLGNTVAELGLTHMPLVGALGALALLQVARKASHLEGLALWPGLAASPNIGYSKPVPDVVRPAWLGLRAWQECGMLELLPPFAGLRLSLEGHSSVWQAYLSLSSTVLGPAPGPGPDPLSLLQKLILWRVLRPECLAGALADLTTSLLGRPLDENLSASTIPFEHSEATQPLLILLPPPGHPTAILHPLTAIQKLAAQHEQGQKHLEVIALGSEAWDPVSVVVSTLRQAMHKGHWLVLENCHLMPHWPKELLQPLLGLLDGAKVVSDLELELLLAQPASRNVVHRDFRLWLLVSAEAISSLPAVLTQHCMPVFWEQSLELGHILINNVELAQQGLSGQPLTRTLPLLFLHGLLLHRQLYGMKLQAHRGHWNQVTLTQVLQMQDQLWASLSNPHAAVQELAASVFYGGPLGDSKDREALISLIHTCLSPSRGSCDHPHTPQDLLAMLMPSPELGELDAAAECKTQMHLLPAPPEPGTCGLAAGPQAWLLRRQSRALLSALRRSSPAWVPAPPDGSRRTERRLRQRLGLATRRLESLQALLAETTRQGGSGAGGTVKGRKDQRTVEGFLQMEVLELSQLVSALQRDLGCLGQRRRHAPAGPQPPWHWLRQLSRRGQLLVRYLGVCTEAPKRTFHLSAFRHPRRLLLSLRWEAAFAMGALDRAAPSPNVPGGQGSSSSHFPHKRRVLNSNPLHLQVVNSPKPTVPEMGLLLVGLQLWNAQWDPLAGALQDGPSSQPSLLPPVSVSVQARGTNDLPPPAGLAVYSCPVYLEGSPGTARLHSRNILVHLPLPTKLSPTICVQRRVHVCSPPLT
ncbi:PREDICTED: dynein heavy chain domain-containing protein 1 [Miniopterus natalensis]|uniref:dynein heavy chain domain-containing protein 1 n=1 Tax=Miniopterus natalensis TaxID=291302 RepID=UPI0007A6A94D|nr:PREDICTED: dynein heavy chain domain-containing protein 1 [Miniopterus natalensis]